MKDMISQYLIVIVGLLVTLSLKDSGISSPDINVQDKHVIVFSGKDLFWAIWAIRNVGKYIFYCFVTIWNRSLLERVMGPTSGPSGADRTQVGPILAPWTLLSGVFSAIIRTNYDQFSSKDKYNLAKQQWYTSSKHRFSTLCDHPKCLSYN